jgi:hypothetical protein
MSQEEKEVELSTEAKREMLSYVLGTEELQDIPVFELLNLFMRAQLENKNEAMSIDPNNLAILCAYAAKLLLLQLPKKEEQPVG